MPFYTQLQSIALQQGFQTSPRTAKTDMIWMIYTLITSRVVPYISYYRSN